MGNKISLPTDDWRVYGSKRYKASGITADKRVAATQPHNSTSAQKCVEKVMRFFSR